MIARYGTFEHALADRYRFDEELGRGAMGIVYRAQDLRLGRSIAIKMLHPGLTSQLGVARFLSESRIAAKLHHENIVGVHESGEVDGRLFYVMDYLGGETLRARLEREKQLPVDDSLRVVKDVGEGLQYAHEQRVVHRDIKPENILLANGRAYLLDFGIARALDEADAQRLTASGLSMGTPQYLSPEQASAEREVGPKADQYALACVLYEMLIGEPPFTGPTASAVAMRHISETPPSMRTRRKTTPVSVESAVTRALEKIPADRFATVKEFVDACGASLEAISPSATPPARSARSVYQAAFLALLGAVALAVGTWRVLTARSDSGSQLGLAARMVEIPAGEYLIGQDTGPLSSRPAHRVHLSAFQIDRDEVTVGEYKRFMDSTGAPRPWPARQSPDRFPVTGVDWRYASAYCRWRYGIRGRLPTEEEWESAARGAKGLLFPWGDRPIARIANTASAGATQPSIIRSFPGSATATGIYDLVGNVWEWTSSQLRAYPDGPALPDSMARFIVIRGGAFDTPDSIANTWFRGYNRTDAAPGDLEKTGFRCVVHASGN